MSLLTDLQRDSLEPGYREAAARGERPSGIRLGATLAVLTALLVVAVTGTFRSSAELEDERSELVVRITAADETRLGLEDEIRDLEDQIRVLGEAGVTDGALLAELGRLAPLVGDVPVAGPGLVISIDDASGQTAGQGLVYDSDLVRLANGLRQAGAEAIAINGRRLSSLTAIRAAGSAITVDYVSISPPYRVEAIGDPDTLEARFARTAAFVWWKYISDNYGVGFTMRESEGDLRLPADPGMVLRFAEKG